MSEFSVRCGEPRDAAVLAASERKHFPARAGVPHGGYVYENPELATALLTEALATPRHMFTFVAEQCDTIIGFALAAPFTLPGDGGEDSAHMLLQYVAVSPRHRRRGVATALVAAIERRALEARQNVIVAHISTEAADFYEASGWETLAEGRGYAWLPFATHLRADIADPDFGFPLMAAKVLRPRAVRHTWDFAILQGRPMLDAAAELARLIEAGTLDVNDLDGLTRRTVEVVRRGPVSQKALDLVDSVQKRSERARSALR